VNDVEATNILTVPNITWAPIVTTTANACTSVVTGVTKKPSCYTYTQTISRSESLHSPPGIHPTASCLSLTRQQSLALPPQV